MLFLKYEELLWDFDNEVRKLAEFLGYPLTDDVLRKIRVKTSFDNMKKDNFANMHEINEFKGFFRKGQIGSWKDQFTVAQSEHFDQMCTERLRGTGLEFEFV